MVVCMELPQFIVDYNSIWFLQNVYPFLIYPIVLFVGFTLTNLNFDLFNDSDCTFYNHCKNQFVKNSFHM